MKEWEKICVRDVKRPGSSESLGGGSWWWEHGVTDGRMSGSGYPRLKAFWQKPPRVSLSSSPPLMPIYRGIWGELDTVTLGSLSRWMWKLSSTTELLGPPFHSGWEAQKVMLKDCFISFPHWLLVISLTSVGKCVLNLKKKKLSFLYWNSFEEKKVVKLDKMTHIICFTYLFYVLGLITYIYWASTLGDIELRIHMDGA